MILAIERTAVPVAMIVVCSKQWRIMSEITEKQRNVTQVKSVDGVVLLLSRIRIVTRARCVLDKSRSNALARWADSTSGAQIIKLSTLVRTLVFWPVRMLSAEMRQRRESSSSIFSMRTVLPAHGRRGPRLLVASLVIRYPLIIKNGTVLMDTNGPVHWYAFNASNYDLLSRTGR